MSSRRTFLKQAGGLAALSTTGIPLATGAPASSPFRIEQVDSNFEREPLRRPFGFKGSAITNIWQIAAMLRSDQGIAKVGLGTQNVLWCDAQVFTQHSENGGNALMYAMTERALQMIKGQAFEDPVQMLDAILEEVYDYGKTITRNPNLRKTFALNALVAVDNAAWLLYGQHQGFATLDEMIPPAYRPALSHQHKAVASIPALGYGTPIEEIKRLADAGHFIMKIKIGAPGTQAEMLEKDKEFLKAIHEAIGHYETAYTKNGKLPYYFDANGRYDNKETLLQFLDYAKKIGAFDQIAVVEEPFGERNSEYVGDIGKIIAADESAHTDEDARTRIEQGYTAIAVKAIAKTFSMTLKIVQVAHEKNIPCFCADLTVNPILVEWNKAIAARLSPFPDMSVGLQETNGWQNYQDWDRMRSYLPMADAPWTKTTKGVYPTDSAFYEQSGGILMPSPHYQEMFGL